MFMHSHLSRLRAAFPSLSVRCSYLSLFLLSSCWFCLGSRRYSPSFAFLGSVLVVLRIHPSFAEDCTLLYLTHTPSFLASDSKIKH